MIISALVNMPMVLCARVGPRLTVVTSTIMTREGARRASIPGLQTAGEPDSTLTASLGTINRQIDDKPHYVNVHNPPSESSTSLRHIGNDEPAPLFHYTNSVLFNKPLEACYGQPCLVHPRSHRA
jgi:hypothetical protein